MDVDIKQNSENKLLNRKEIVAHVGFEGPTPKRADIKQSICSKVGANPELMVLRNTLTRFGMHKLVATVHLYPVKEVLVKTEPRYILVREGLVPKKAKRKKVVAAPKKKKV